MATVLFFAALRDATKCRSDIVDGTTVEEVLTHCKLRYGELFERILPYCLIMVDDRSARLDTPVGPMSEVALLPPVSGG